MDFDCSVSRTCLSCGRQTCDFQPEDRDSEECKKWTLNEKRELEVLREFFKTVAGLTLNHDVVSVKGSDVAHVSPSKLGEALAKVNKNWWEKV